MKIIFALVLGWIFSLTAVAAQTKNQYQVGSTYSITYEGYYENEYVCKKTPVIKTNCGFYRECDFGRCKETPGCYKVGTFEQKCGFELVHKIRPVTGGK